MQIQASSVDQQLSSLPAFGHDPGRCANIMVQSPNRAFQEATSSADRQCAVSAQQVDSADAFCNMAPFNQQRRWPDRTARAKLSYVLALSI